MLPKFCNGGSQISTFSSIYHASIKPAIAGRIEFLIPLFTKLILAGFPANSTTSMQRDIADGLPSELDVQNGAVVRLATEVGVDTPLNRFLLYSLRSLELRARGALKF